MADDGYLSDASEVEEQPDLYCVQDKYILVVYNLMFKFKLHPQCYHLWEGKEDCIIRRVVEQRSHLCLNAPFAGCAHCGLNVYFIGRAADCDFCCEFEDEL